MKNNKTTKFLLVIFLTLIFIGLTVNRARAVESTGFIVYEHKGKLRMIRPDKSDEKVISERGATGGALISPNGDAIVYPYDNKIYHISVPSLKEKLLYTGNKDDKIDLYSWRSKMEGFIFRKRIKDDLHEYYLFNIKDNQVTKLKDLFENPFMSECGNYWAYTTIKPGTEGKESQIYAGKITDKKARFVFQGRRKDILGWNRENPVVLYSKFDKIYAFDVINRYRQIIRLPSGFRDVFVIAYNNMGLLYYNKNQEENDKGILLLDPNSGEQKALIESDKTAYLVTYNRDRSKLVFFAPTKMYDDLGHGELYLFESKTGEATKLTRETGKRILVDKTLNYQWSPDGKYFVYERLKMKFTNIKRSDLWVAGEGKNDQLMKRSGNPVWGVLKDE